MNSEKESGAPPQAGAGAPPERPGHPADERVRYRRETLIPTLAVTAVAIAAVATAVMVKRIDAGSAELAAAPPAAQTQASVAAPAQAAPDTSTTAPAVVKAPPLKPTSKEATQAQARAADSATAPTRSLASAMGGARACGNCGVVETVVAVHEYAKPEPKGYQMHIRMDDGSFRTVEQRGALAAGSRVVVENGAVRAMTQPS